jgi:ABC-type multidrug transport system permease subunit
VGPAGQAPFRLMEAASLTQAGPAQLHGRGRARAQVWALTRRALNEILRVPGAAIPGVLAPTIFMLGLTSVFGDLTRLPGFTAASYISFLIPVSLMQGAGFTGAATGVNLARDIEQGWFDRLLASSAARTSLLQGIVFSASFRALIPATVLLGVGFMAGVHWPGALGLAIAIFVAMCVALIMALWGVTLAMRFRTQAAAPLMQISNFVAVLFTTAYAPQQLLTGWLQTVAKYNPMTQAVETARQGFVGEVTWQNTWPGLLALAWMILFFGWLALRTINRYNR